MRPGNIVTTARSDMMYVVAEHGIANLSGTSVPGRARALIAFAKPDYREGPERKARGNGIIPKHYR